ncbi:MAG TPA: aldo/keto reductase [Candidatus Saccharimonadales bacterium]|nr:aldo/keto reductase [Candidatus Saccharimonadales bacterium]
MANGTAAGKAGTVQIGDITVNRMGLGTNRVSDTEAARQVLKRAVDLGVNFIDTAHRYQQGASEATIGQTLAPYAKGVVVATKGGWDNDSLDDIREQLELSLQRLHLDCINLYQLHRINPNIPFVDTLGLLKEFQEAGKIHHIGLSEVTIEQLQAARKVAPIVSVQNQYNVANRQHEELVDYCTEHGIVFIPWFPLGGLAGDAQKINDLLGELAGKYQATPQQLALAWLLKRSPLILPIPGTLSIEHLASNLQAAAIELSEEDYQNLLIS